MNSTTNTPAVGLIWAQGRNGIIGMQGQMPWHLPEDLAHFKSQTMGSPVIMGRKTWDSIPPQFRPLPGRRNIVISRQDGWASVGAEAAHSVEEALHLCQGERRVWVIGGGQIYEQAMPYADLVEMTQIDVAPKGDTQAPKLDDEWERQTVSEWRSSRSGLRYRFATYVRHLPSKTLETGFGSSQIPTEFPITQAPTDFGHTETDTDTDTGADTETETETPTGFTHTEAPSGFASTLPPGFTP